MHARVDVAEPPIAPNYYEQYVCGNTADDLDAIATLDGQLPDAVMFGDLLLKDIEDATAEKGDMSCALKSDASPLFASGLSAALADRRAMSFGDTPEALPKLAPEELINFLLSNPEMPMLTLVECLAPHNPEAAVMAHFLENAMLIRSVPEVTQQKRYQYVKDIDLNIISNIRAEDDVYLQTFLHGIDRLRDQKPGVDGEWRLRQESGLLKTCNKSEVMAHVLTNALQHMKHPNALNEDVEPYPLTVYRLLSAMSDDMPIPLCLTAHENRLIASANENAEKVVANGIKSHKNIRAAKAAQPAINANLKEESLAAGFGDPGQYIKFSSGFSPDLVTKSVDARISLSGSGTVGTSPQWIRSQLEINHVKQAIGNRSAANPSLADQRSWLRSAWLSVFASVTSPEDLSDRFRSAHHADMPARPERNQRLKAIARLYFESPRAFMQSIQLDGTEICKTVAPWSENVRIAAHLGPLGPLDYLLGKRLPEDDRRKDNSNNIEFFLKDIHERIAAAFYFTDPSILSFIKKSEKGEYPHADSTMPVVLHRGLGLSVMVVEQGARDVLTDEGEWVAEYVNSLRVAAPIESGLASLIKPDHEESAIEPAELVETLLAEFYDKPVIWLEDGNHSLYLPKHLTENDDESDVMPGVDGFGDPALPMTTRAEFSPSGRSTHTPSPKKGWGDSAKDLWHQFSGGGSL